MSSAAVLGVAILMILATATGAHAYIDPGSGSMLLQLLLGGVAGLVVLAKLYWHRLLRLLGLGGRNVDEEQTTAERSADTGLPRH